MYNHYDGPPYYPFRRSPYHWNVPTHPAYYGYPAYHPQIPYRQVQDSGKKPFVININEAAKHNQTYRTAIWTGEHLQVTLMSIQVGDDVGLEIHPHTDQFLRIEAGQGIVKMGATKDRLDFEQNVTDDDAIMVPAGTWHNIINTGHVPLKLYTIYAPPHHPFGTIEHTHTTHR